MEKTQGTVPWVTMPSVCACRVILYVSIEIQSNRSRNYFLFNVLEDNQN